MPTKRVVRRLMIQQPGCLSEKLLMSGMSRENSSLSERKDQQSIDAYRGQ